MALRNRGKFSGGKGRSSKGKSDFQKKFTKVGAAWENESGSITIKFDDSDTTYLLFENKYKERDKDPDYRVFQPNEEEEEGGFYKKDKKKSGSKSESKRRRDPGDDDEDVEDEEDDEDEDDDDEE